MTIYNEENLTYNNALRYNNGIPLVEFPAVNLDIYINQGSTFSKNFVIIGDGGYAVKLNDVVISASLKRYYNERVTGIPFIVTVSGVETGKINLTLTEEQTDLLVNSRYVYEILLTGNNQRIKLFHGQALITNKP